MRDGAVFVDGALVANAHAVHSEGAGGPDYGPTVLSKRSYLVLGDNRGNNKDSRMFGVVDRNAF